MSVKCDICGDSWSVLRTNGLILCDNCAYDPNIQLEGAIAEALDEFIIGSGNRREFVSAVKSIAYKVRTKILREI